MNIDDILHIESPAWLLTTFVVLFVVGVVLMVLLITSEKRKHTIIRLAAAVLCVGSALGLYAVENDRIAVAKEAVVDGFAQAYGLELDDRDTRYLVEVDRKDVTRNLETADGSLKQVLFRADDDKVLPYTVNSEGSWTPLPAVGNAR